MLVGSRRTRKTRHSKRACHRTRHSRGTWKRTETFTYHGKRWSKPYIPIQHRSINRANTDKREISIGRLQILLSRRKTFAVIASGGNYREDHRRFSSPSRPSCVSSPISHYYEGTYERYFLLQDYLILTVRLFSHAWDSNAFTWETRNFNVPLMGQPYNIQRLWFVLQACDLPLYWKVPLFLAAGGDQTGYVEMNAFLDFWKEE